ncbi:hypothetical protein D3C86_1812250 [compost metagenome]
MSLIIFPGCATVDATFLVVLTGSDAKLVTRFVAPFTVLLTFFVIPHPTPFKNFNQSSPGPPAGDIPSGSINRIGLSKA